MYPNPVKLSMGGLMARYSCGRGESVELEDVQKAIEAPENPRQ